MIFDLFPKIFRRGSLWFYHFLHSPSMLTFYIFLSYVHFWGARILVKCRVCWLLKILIPNFVASDSKPDDLPVWWAPLNNSVRGRKITRWYSFALVLRSFSDFSQFCSKMLPKALVRIGLTAFSDRWKSEHFLTSFLAHYFWPILGMFGMFNRGD
jgi:hypothetical protein